MAGISTAAPATDAYVRQPVLEFGVIAHEPVRVADVQLVGLVESGVTLGRGVDAQADDASKPRRVRNDGVRDVVGVGTVDEEYATVAVRSNGATQGAGREGAADLATALQRGLNEGSSLSTVAKRLRWQAQARQAFGKLLQYAAR